MLVLRVQLYDNRQSVLFVGQVSKKYTHKPCGQSHSAAFPVKVKEVVT